MGSYTASSETSCYLVTNEFRKHDATIIYTNELNSSLPWKSIATQICASVKDVST